MPTFLDFEKPIAELEGKIEELRHLSDAGDLNITDEVVKLQDKVNRLLTQTYAKLSSWQKVQVARHPDRPHAMDCIEALVEEFVPLAGDRAYAEDRAIVGGLGRFRGQAVVVLGTEKGHDTESRVIHNFGMARPEGYRKAQRLMRLADRFGLPVIALVDTSGAYPGKGAEERGQAEAIARSIETCLDLKVPLVAVIIGEGGSGGAIALAAGNAILMMEHAIYSVISPEGCASILWRSSDQAKEAAEALKLTAQDLLELGVIDAIVPEPLGGAHRDRKAAMKSLRRRDRGGAGAARGARRQRAQDAPAREVPGDGNEGPGLGATAPRGHGVRYDTRPWQCLYFLPEPHGQGALRGTLPQLAGSSRSMTAGPGARAQRQALGRAAVGARHLALLGRVRRGQRRVDAALLGALRQLVRQDVGRRLLEADLEMGEHARHLFAQPRQHLPRTARTPRSCIRSAGRSAHRRAG